MLVLLKPLRGPAATTNDSAARRPQESIRILYPKQRKVQICQDEGMSDCQAPAWATALFFCCTEASSW